MKLLDNMDKLDRQYFKWGEISWLHEPEGTINLRVSVARVVIYPGCAQEKHFHLGEEQLFFVEKGSASFFSDGVEEKIGKGDVVYIKPYSEHEVINTGSEELVLNVVYVPVKVMHLERHSLIPVDRKLEDIISLEILESIQRQLSELLKMDIFILDQDSRRIVSNNRENPYCLLCEKGGPCSMKSHHMDRSSPLKDATYKCDLNLMELKVPIIINETILGYIKSDRFILGNPEDMMDNVKKLSAVIGSDLDSVLNAFGKVPQIIRSRLYVIHEHLHIAADFIREILERSMLEQELMEKDNEILTSAKEKLALKDALNKANHRIFNEGIFSGKKTSRESVYPYDLELSLEKALTDQDLEKALRLIDSHEEVHQDQESVVQEMILVLSRTALKNLGDPEATPRLRARYGKPLLGEFKANPMDALRSFCRDCIDEYKATSRENSMEVIRGINQYIQAHYREELSLNLLAEKFYISPNYLSTLFNERNGISFSEYIQNLRLEEAKNLLANTRMKVVEISSKVGYKSNSYFTSIFRKNVGMTPNQYRKSSRLK